MKFFVVGLRGRCYDHNFQRFLPVLGGKIDVFLKNQCCDPLKKTQAAVLAKKRQFFFTRFWRK
jgi:hypothetical protein